MSNRCRALYLVAGLGAGVTFAAGQVALAAPFTVGYADGSSWNTIYAQGFSTAQSPNPDPALAAGDQVLLDQFQFFKGGNADAASNIRLAIIQNFYADLSGFSTASPYLVGLSNNTIGTTADIATGAPITFDFDNLALAHGTGYGAVMVNVAENGTITPVLVSALTADYVETAPGSGTYVPESNYGTDTDYHLAVSNWINTNEFGQYFSPFSYSADATFLASLLTPGAAGSTWALTTSGDWNSPASWNGGVPNATGASATLGSAGGSGAVQVDVGAGGATVGALAFDNNAGTYTITGSGPLTLDATAAPATITVTSGSHAIQAPVALVDNTTVTVTPAASTLTVGNLAQTSATLTKNGAGTLVVDKVRAGGLAVDAGKVRIAKLPGAPAASKVSALSVADGAQLDLTDNAIVVAAGDLGSWDGDSYTGIQGLIGSGRAEGAWTGDGIVTSESNAAALRTGLAVAKAGDVPSIVDAGMTFAGVSVAPTDVVVMYTWAGDVDMNGTLDADDYFYIDQNINQSGSVFGFRNGDVDLNGFIDGDDYFYIDQQISNQDLGVFPNGAGSATVTAVPEPGAAAACLFAGSTALLARRRRRRCRASASRDRRVH